MKIKLLFAAMLLSCAAMLFSSAAISQAKSIEQVNTIEQTNTGDAGSARAIEQKIQEAVKDREATVGVAVLHNGKEVTLNNDGRYPLMSVFKFHIAVTVLKKMETENISLDSTICIREKEVQRDTYSPMLKKYPDGDICMTYGEMLEFMVSHSDNNACNRLIEFAGEIGEVDRYIRSLGIENFSLTETERTMQEDIYRSYNNWSSPLDMARLLEKVYTENVLSGEHFAFLEKAMLNSSSGSNKIKAGLPENVTIGHKTGSSFRRPDVIQICENDAGVLYMPDGSKAYLVVFVKDSKESDAANAEIIADVARAVYPALLQNL